jgi:hypothetical protein
MIPTAALAGNQYATVDSAYQSDQGMIVTTLRAQANQDPVEGNYVFEGFAMQANDRLTVPWTVTVPAELASSDAALALAASAGNMTQIYGFEFSAENAVVSKAFYDVSGEDARGILAVTDDPLPIIGWLVIAGVSSIVLPIGIYITQCSHIETKTTISTDGTATFETSCDR